MKINKQINKVCYDISNHPRSQVRPPPELKTG